MKIILTKDVETLGNEGDIVEVKNGYARNYLLPSGFAVIANTGNLKTWENEKKARERRIAKEIESAKKQAEALSSAKYEIKVKVGEEGKLYGSVTTQDIAEVVSEVSKIEIDRKKITIADAIKAVGEYKATVKIYKDVKAELTISVVSEAAPEAAPEEEEQKA